MRQKHFGIEEQLRQAILNSEMSRYRLSKVTGIDQAVLSNFVNCKRTITLTTAAKLAQALGLSLKDTVKKDR